MTKLNYAKEIAAQIDGAEVKEVEKNNGVIYTGIQIPTETNVSPVIYIDGFYEDNCPVNEAVDHVLRIYANTSSQAEAANNVAGLVKDFDKAKAYIQPRLVGYDLAVVPTIPYLDLYIYFVIQLDKSASVKVNQQILDGWGKTVDDLLPIATDNIESKCVTMMDMLMGLIPESKDLDYLDDSNPMYVLTNESQIYGAAAILKGDLARFNQKFYVLPSSVHEWIFVPTDSGMDPDALTEMVRSVNSEAVAPEDVLSDHAYLWNGTYLEMA